MMDGQKPCDDLMLQLAVAIAHIQRTREIQLLKEKAAATRNSKSASLSDYFTSAASTSRCTESGIQRTSPIQSYSQLNVSPNIAFPERLVASQPNPRKSENTPRSRSAAAGKCSVAEATIEWEEKLNHLSILFSAMSDGTVRATRMYAYLDEKFRNFVSVLCITAANRRPPAVFTLIEIYAENLVKLQQYCMLELQQESNCQFETLLYVAIFQILSFWLRDQRRGAFNEYNRMWLHTRTVVKRMLKSIIVPECVLAVTHNLAGMLQETTMLILENRDHISSYENFGPYACEQLKYFMTLLNN